MKTMSSFVCFAAWTPPLVLAPTQPPPPPETTQAPSPGLGDPRFEWASGEDLLENCNATLLIQYDGGIEFKACMTIYDKPEFCSYIGYVECRPVHVPISATGWCAGATLGPDEDIEVIGYCMLMLSLVLLICDT